MADDTIRSLKDLRAWYGDAGRGLSDEDMMSGFAKVTGANTTDLANAFGYDPGSGSKTGERFTAAGANYVGNLQGVGGAVARATGLPGADWLDGKRRANDFQAGVAGDRARSLGAVDSFKDVHSASDFGDYAAGVGIGAAPYLGEAALTAATGGVSAEIMGGLRGAAGAARLASGGAEAFQAAKASANVAGRTAGVGLGSYPSSVGMALQAQREQNGTEDLGSAGVAGAAISALNILNPTERIAARLGNAKGTVLDGMNGVGGAIARMGVNGARSAVEQGAVMTGQTAAMQGARMAVDPNEAWNSDASIERAKESAAAGLTLGGLTGALHGGWKRGKTPVDLAPDLLHTDERPGATPPQPLGADAAPPEPAPSAAPPEAPGPDQAPPAAPEAPVPQNANDKAAIAAASAEFARRRQDATDKLVDNGPDGKPAIALTPDVVKLHHELTEARDAGRITSDQYVGMAGGIKEALYANDKKSIGAVRRELDGLLNPKPGAKPAEAAGSAEVAPGADGGRSDQRPGSSPAVDPVGRTEGGRDDHDAARPAAGDAADLPVEVGSAGGEPAAVAPGPHDQYAGRSVTVSVPHPTDPNKSIRRTVKDAKAALDEAQDRGSKFDELAECLGR